ncbi:Uncharacterized protein GBIM_11407 [Gryllus bimaculatus]|nr:Uncharacterized protein GBIM_11407 [Gryllus bimaculatus]
MEGGVFDGAVPTPPPRALAGGAVTARCDRVYYHTARRSRAAEGVEAGRAERVSHQTSDRWRCGAPGGSAASEAASLRSAHGSGAWFCAKAASGAPATPIRAAQSKPASRAPAARAPLRAPPLHGHAAQGAQLSSGAGARRSATQPTPAARLHHGAREHVAGSAPVHRQVRGVGGAAAAAVAQNHARVRSEVRLPRVLRAHHNATVTCLVRHSALPRPLNASLLLDVQYTPSFAISREPGFGFPLVEGIPVSLKCETRRAPK